jgi:pimeloyl-ACP methyl ester carboxylesterase
MNRVALVLLAGLLASACAAQAGSPYPLDADAEARRWGDGAYGLVLLPDANADDHPAAWDAQARAFADEGMTVVALGAADASQAAEAIGALHADGVERVAVLAAGEGTAAALELGVQSPELVDQLILISARGDVSSLGVFPKLFVASEGEAAAADAERMVDEAPGDWNAIYLAEGAASGREILAGDGAEEAMEAVIQRLEERR